MKRKVFQKSYGNYNDRNLHSTTFNGFGEECVTAIKAIEILQSKKYCNSAQNIEKIVNKRFKLIAKNYPEYQMIHRGCGAVQKIYINNYKLVKEIINKKLKKKEKILIKLIKNRILEIAINDELYHTYKIFAFQTLSTIVISPSLVIKSTSL